MSKRLSVVVRGLTETKTALEKLGQQTVTIFDVATREWANNVIREQLAGPAQYPAELPNQRYRRTYGLASGWRNSRVRQGRWRIWNTQPYASDVVGDASGANQAPIHRGRWWIAKERIDRQLAELKPKTEMLYERNFNTWAKQ